MIEKFNHQQWYQKPETFEFHDSGCVVRFDRLDTVPVRTRWSENRSIYCSGLAYFTMKTEYTNACYFGVQLSPKIDMFAMWLRSMFEIILSVKIKYDDSRNWNNFAMMKFLMVGFDSIENHNSYLCFILFSFWID